MKPCSSKGLQNGKRSMLEIVRKYAGAAPGMMAWECFLEKTSSELKTKPTKYTARVNETGTIALL